jgi:hypothetical protein
LENEAISFQSTVQYITSGTLALRLNQDDTFAKNRRQLNSATATGNWQVKSYIAAEIC